MALTLDREDRDERQEDQCPVCLGLLSEPVPWPTCEHYFCLACSLRLRFRAKPSCPLCRCDADHLKRGAELEVDAARAGQVRRSVGYKNYEVQRRETWAQVAELQSPANLGKMPLVSLGVVFLPAGCRRKLRFQEPSHLDMLRRAMAPGGLRSFAMVLQPTEIEVGARCRVCEILDSIEGVAGDALVLVEAGVVARISAVIGETGLVHGALEELEEEDDLPLDAAAMSSVLSPLSAATEIVGILDTLGRHLRTMRRHRLMLALMEQEIGDEINFSGAALEQSLVVRPRPGTSFGESQTTHTPEADEEEEDSDRMMELLTSYRQTVDQMDDLLAEASATAERLGSSSHTVGGHFSPDSDSDSRASREGYSPDQHLQLESVASGRSSPFSRSPSRPPDALGALGSSRPRPIFSTASGAILGAVATSPVGSSEQATLATPQPRLVASVRPAAPSTGPQRSFLERGGAGEAADAPRAAAERELRSEAAARTRPTAPETPSPTRAAGPRRPGLEPGDAAPAPRRPPALAAPAAAAAAAAAADMPALPDGMSYARKQPAAQAASAAVPQQASWVALAAGSAAQSGRLGAGPQRPFPLQPSAGGWDERPFDYDFADALRRAPLNDVAASPDQNGRGSAVSAARGSTTHGAQSPSSVRGVPRLTDLLRSRTTAAPRPVSGGPAAQRREARESPRPSPGPLLGASRRQSSGGPASGLAAVRRMASSHGGGAPWRLERRGHLGGLEVVAAATSRPVTSASHAAPPPMAVRRSFGSGWRPSVSRRP